MTKRQLLRRQRNKALGMLDYVPLYDTERDELAQKVNDIMLKQLRLDYMAPKDKKI